jgi:pimeloyl-ACP methyl ester carboxylesterase
MAEGDSESHFFQRGSIRLHYTVTGSGPTLVFIHGLPDFWKGWRYQIAHFRGVFRSVALDLRGVNLSDQPATMEAYRMGELVRDAVGLINHLGLEKVTIVGHDWGALIGWWTAILAPKRVERLAALSAPHPSCYATARENGNVYYAPDYHAQVAAAQPGAPFNVDRMTRRVADPVARAELNDALQRSGIECLRNFYRANEAVPSARLAALPPVRVPVLSLYGENDPFITPEAYEKSALYVRSDFRLLAMPKAGHFPHQDAPTPVNLELERWLHDHH